MKWIDPATRKFVESAARLGVASHSWSALAEGAALLLRLAARIGEKKTDVPANEIVKAFLRHADAQLDQTDPRELRTLILGLMPAFPGWRKYWQTTRTDRRPRRPKD